jgi:hypothetical protein
LSFLSQILSIFVHHTILVAAGVRVAVLLATVPVEQAAHNRLQSNIKPKTFLASFMLDAPSDFYLKLSIFSVLLKVGSGEESHYPATNGWADIVGENSQ